MSQRSLWRVSLAIWIGWWFSIATPPTARSLEPIVYTVRLAAPDTHTVEVEATFPTGRRPTVDLMMAVWSPGFYRVENYASRIQAFTARTRKGGPLHVAQPSRNRWQVQTNGEPSIVVSYRLECSERSVTTNWVSPELVVLNGAATFVTLLEQARRSHEVLLELPPTITRVATALERATNGPPDRYRAADFDTLVDSPIVAGALSIHEFRVDGRLHELVDAGDRDGWDGERAAGDLAKVVQEARQMWGFLPYKRYVFLNVFRQGGGGLEHKDSTLLTVNTTRASTPTGYRSWLAFVAHEYFHAFNVKRLRPVELGPFDYEREPHTASLWVAEGLTSYYEGLLLGRSGLAGPTDYLESLSSQVRQLQQSPGRLAQTLERSSLDVWTNSMSGVNPGAGTVSYYIKGEVVGFLLDARIRRATNGSRSLDDVMKLAYKRYGGDRGFTPEQFRQAAEQTARDDLREWFRRAVSSTEELDYSEALEWYGLRFSEADSPGDPQTWRLEARPDATTSQKAHFASLLTSGSRR